MSEPYQAQQGLILVRTEITGPGGTAVARLALDTGALFTVISSAAMMKVGFDPAQSPHRTQIVTVSGLAVVPQISLLKLRALGVERMGFSVLAHTFPAHMTVDGLLGLDFFRGQVLTLDFQQGEITLA
jgi:hypothetical protein